VGGKDNGLEPGNRISTLMSSVLDLLTSKSIRNIFLQWTIHICDMVTKGGKGNILEPGNHFIYRQTDNPIPVYPPHTFDVRGIKTFEIPTPKPYIFLVLV
jgi:hypothetical protein